MSNATHICDAIVIKCMDWRIEASGFFRQELQKAIGIKEFDVVSVAGGAKSILDGSTQKTIMNYIDLSFRLHHIKKVILTNHTECGVYGNSGTEERLIGDLRAARRILLEHFSGLKIQLLLVRLIEKNGMWDISIEKEFDKDRDAVSV